MNDLAATWRKRSMLEDDIASVCIKHDDAEGAREHQVVARTWRQAAYELEEKLKEKKT